MKVFVVGLQTSAARWIKGSKLTDTLEEADLVLFTGGGDISNKLYGCKKHPSTCPDTARDAEEVALWNKIKPTQKVVGICRGAQLITAMLGGKLIQDVNNHWCGRTHMITDGERAYAITSLHHQMCFPFNMDKKHYDVLYWSYNNSSDYYRAPDVDIEAMTCEPEVIAYHVPNKPKCLAIQGHPEMMPLDHVTVNMFNDLIEKL